MAERYGARMGRDILFGSQNYARDAYNPSEPRGQPGNPGQWGPGGASAGKAGGGERGGGGGEAPKREASGTGSSAKTGVVAHGPAGAAKWRDEVTAGTDCCKTIDDLISSSEKNQVLLADAATRIAKEIGLEFKNPGPKKREPLAKKLSKPGKTPARITDAARGGFNVTKPEQADAIVAGFAKEFPIADEGWAVTNVGYFDRKLMIKFPNGQMGEVQIWEPSLLDAKEKKGGHDHYEKWRVLPPDDHEGQARETAAMRAIYQPVLDALSPEWKAVTGKGGSSPNASEKASGVNR